MTSTAREAPHRALDVAGRSRASRQLERHRRRRVRPTRRRRRAARYGTDALKQGHPADLVVLPGTTAEIAAIARLCHAHARAARRRAAPAPATPAARCPSRGGVVLSLERLNRILEIDEPNLLAVVEPNVITGDLQDAVERVGLFYPPDPGEPAAVGRSAATSPSAPAARARSSTARRSATCSALEAVLPTGEIIEHRRQGREERRRLRPDAAARRVGGHAGDHHRRSSCGWCRSRPRRRRCARASPTSTARSRRSTALIRAARRAGGDRADRRRLARGGRARTSDERRWRPRAPARCCSSRWTACPAAVDGGGASRRARRCRDAGAIEVLRARRRGRARGAVARAPRAVATRCARSRRSRSTTTSSCRAAASRSCSRWSSGCERDYRPARSRASATPATATSTSTSWSTPPTPTRWRARTQAERALFEGVVALEGSISGEHGIGVREGAVSSASSSSRDGSR